MNNIYRLFLSGYFVKKKHNTEINTTIKGIEKRSLRENISQQILLYIRYICCNTKIFNKKYCNIGKYLYLCIVKHKDNMHNNKQANNATLWA